MNFDTPVGTLSTEELFDRIPELVALAKANFKQHVEDLLALYELRKHQRKFPVIALLGHGRAGKDCGAEYLRDHYELDYSGSVSEFVAPFVAYSLGQPQDVAYADRHNNRMFWFHFCNELRSNDASFLVKMCMTRNDLVAGIRAGRELEASKEQGVIQYSFWIDNPLVPEDPTLEYTVDDCDFVIRNAGTLQEYYDRLDSLAGMLNFDSREGHNVGEIDG